MATKKTAAKSPAKAAAEKTTPAKAPAKAAAKSAAKKTATTSGAAASKKQPTHQEIAALAHKYFQERGHHHGSHVDDWLRAEKELNS